MNRTDRPKPVKPETDRRAEALRENLRKRKEQARLREEKRREGGQG